MNSVNVYSAESASGVRGVKCCEVAQDLCVGKVVVNYLCGRAMPSDKEALLKLDEKIKEVKHRMCKKRADGVNVPGRYCPTQELPHSTNWKNGNRIRQSLLRQRYWIGQKPGLADEERRRQLEEIRQQLVLYPPRFCPIKCNPRAKSSKLKEAKKVRPKTSPASDRDRADKPSPYSVKHFCKSSSRIRREVAHDKVFSRSKSCRRKYNVGSWRGQRQRRQHNGSKLSLWKKMKELVLQRM